MINNYLKVYLSLIGDSHLNQLDSKFNQIIDNNSSLFLNSYFNQNGAIDNKPLKHLRCIPKLKQDMFLGAKAPLGIAQVNIKPPPVSI